MSDTEVGVTEVGVTEVGVTERLFAEFTHLHALPVITAVVRQAGADLRGAPPGGVARARGTPGPAAAEGSTGTPPH